MVSESNLNDLLLAVLIDADNVPRDCIKGIMEEIALYGTPTIKRIYGDWTSPNIAGWKASLLENAITPIQQYGYTTGKNSTDSAMIIDAMDILYAGRTNGFVIVSSDSDFTRLAIRLREAGQRVIGIGEEKTPKPFIVACDKFIYIEVIRANSAENAEPAEAAGQPVKKTSEKTRSRSRSKKKLPRDLIQLIADSVENLAGDQEWVYMGELGNLISKKRPDFDSRNYGYRSLSALIKSIPRFEVDFRQTTDPNIKHPFVRDKEA